MSILLAAALSLSTANAASTAVTLSPIHLTLPVLEVSVERSLAEKLTASVIAGGGKSSGSPLWELGAQGRYLLLGDFGTNLHLAAEVLYIGSRATIGTATATATAGSFGPLVGGKWTADVGFTAELQAGVGYNIISATGSDANTTQTAREAGLYTNININLGWSF